jgi:hypothetical protein
MSTAPTPTPTTPFGKENAAANPQPAGGSFTPPVVATPPPTSPTGDLKELAPGILFDMDGQAYRVFPPPPTSEDDGPGGAPAYARARMRKTPYLWASGFFWNLGPGGDPSQYVTLSTAQEVAAMISEGEVGLVAKDVPTPALQNQSSMVMFEVTSGGRTKMVDAGLEVMQMLRGVIYEEDTRMVVFQTAWMRNKILGYFGTAAR